MDSKPPIQSNISGFSLLEAIVAITIMAGFGMAIFSWLNTNLTSISKIESRAYKDQLIRNASEFMQDIDIMSEPSGSSPLSVYDIHWQSKLVEPVKQGKSKSGSLSEFQLGLYQTEVTIFQQTKPITSFELRLVGYQKVRDYQSVFN